MLFTKGCCWLTMLSWPWEHRKQRGNTKRSAVDRLGIFVFVFFFFEKVTDLWCETQCLLKRAFKIPLPPYVFNRFTRGPWCSKAPRVVIPCWQNATDMVKKSKDQQKSVKGRPDKAVNPIYIYMFVYVATCICICRYSCVHIDTYVYLYIHKSICV